MAGYQALYVSGSHVMMIERLDATLLIVDTDSVYSLYRTMLFRCRRRRIEHLDAGAYRLVHHINLNSCVLYREVSLDLHFTMRPSRTGGSRDNS
jgi:hypothetical protein